MADPTPGGRYGPFRRDARPPVIAAPQKGIVFLATPKCASTSIEEVLTPYAQVILKGLPSVKHTHYRGFRRFIEPLLAARGFPRDRYEVVCLMREPTDWLHSWYRYRSREGMAGKPNFTGGMTFDAFVRAYLEGVPPATVGRQADFVRDNDGSLGVDRLFRYEDLGRFVTYLEGKLGAKVELPARNTSPVREVPLSEDLQRELHTHLARDYELYASLR